MADSVRVYLIVDGGGQCRLAKRRPTLDWDEVAFPIIVQIPQGWAKVYDAQALRLNLPEPEHLGIEAGEPELPEVETVEHILPPLTDNANLDEYPRG
jgi:hypothetical protein